VDGLSLVQCPNGLVIDEFMRWMIQAGYLTHSFSSIA